MRANIYSTLQLPGNSLVVQWLGLHAPRARVQSLVRELKEQKLQLPVTILNTSRGLIH